MGTFLTLVSGLAWTIVYVAAIRVGFRDRTYAMPVAALGLNIAWESTYAARALVTGVSVQGVINLVWGLAEAEITQAVDRELAAGRRPALSPEQAQKAIKKPTHDSSHRASQGIQDLSRKSRPGPAQP